MVNFVREALNGGNKSNPLQGLGWNKAKGQFNDARAKIFGNRIKKAN